MAQSSELTSKPQFGQLLTDRRMRSSEPVSISISSRGTLEHHFDIDGIKLVHPLTPIPLRRTRGS